MKTESETGSIVEELQQKINRNEKTHWWFLCIGFIVCMAIIFVSRAIFSMYLDNLQTSYLVFVIGVLTQLPLLFISFSKHRRNKEAITELNCATCQKSNYDQLQLVRLTGNCVHCGTRLLEGYADKHQQADVPLQPLSAYRAEVIKFQNSKRKYVFYLIGYLIAMITIVLMITSIFDLGAWGGVLLLIGMFGAFVLVYLEESHRKKFIAAHPILKCPSCQCDLINSQQIVIATKCCYNCGRRLFQTDEA